ncbi:hypothetical protein [Neomegalonema sp.]|uniref:hypothetical protein n=1 Tax=Neomegalonema sp. TaxID=2039713 RepID=UPI00260B24F8|nr:hypothetical protein [Neomegalonema sp.]MDD2868178.1 hypothetical protein [Neomegalonema sp.]
MANAPAAWAFQPAWGSSPRDKAKTEPAAPPPEDLRLMAEIGFLAIREEQGAALRPVFEMLDALQPDNAAGAIGLAMIEAAAGREREALALLRRAILTRKRSVREAKATFCALAAAFGRDSEALQWRRELLRGPDSGARRLAAAPVARRRK